MIVFDLECRDGLHRFEGWFASSADFASQSEGDLIVCPVCGSTQVAKAPMAPAVGRKGNKAVTAAAKAAVSAAAGPRAEEIRALAAMQASVLKGSRWVGGDFADVSRAMHYGEREAEVVHGEATPREARDLLEEGVTVMPLPFPVAPPDKVN
ncbi:DUF1178 family protein [Parablastomonas sp. CN1-191]|uniref:DUF1178 family protein n=1 Tax=Parablastomonas sp. CN1-191 TaxID=3400908 RepID=UPI003BF8E895